MIATRTLQFNDGSETRDIPIRIFGPQDQGDNWSCGYEIDWPEGRRTMEVSGIDSVQPLLLALQMIGAALYAYDHNESGRLVFHEPGKGYGFPVPVSLRHLPIGNDRKYGA